MNNTGVSALAAALAVSVAVAGGLETVEDVRVDALVDSHWGQRSDTGYVNTGSPCFNFYTPSNYPCGCVATPIAQILRYWRYPASVAAGVSLCMVDGVETELEYGGVEYDYDAMPGIAAGADEYSRAAIGRLAFDCAAAVHSMFSSENTYAFGTVAFVQMRDTFGYASAVGYVPYTPESPSSAMENTIIANLDAKCPVVVALRSDASKKAHQALIDGYGYQGGKLHFHFNLGWCNISGDDAWYELDKATSGHSGVVYDLIDGLIFNIFPDFTGEPLSGRVLDADGKPVAGATVQALLNKSVVGSVQTDDKGIYAFILPGGQTYKVESGSGSLSVFLPSSASARNEYGDIWEDPFHPAITEQGALGGSSGNDITPLSGQEQDPDPENVAPGPSGPESGPDPENAALGPFNPTKAGKGTYPYCGAVYDADGNPCGTMTVKFTKPSKKGESKISASLRLLDGKTYSMKAVPVPVSKTDSARVEGAAVKKLGTLDLLVVGEDGFAAGITTADGSKLTAATADLSKGLVQGDYRFKVAGIPAEINGLPVVTEMMPPEGTEFSVNARGKISLAKAAKLKYAKIKGVTPAAYELVCDTEKGKTNLPGLKLTYSAKTASIKGSFSVYTDDSAKHKIKKTSFTVTGMVIDGKAVGIATCKKLALSYPITIEPE